MESKFKIHQFDFEEVDEKPYSVKMSDIGNQILSLDLIKLVSNSAIGFSITVAPDIGLRGGRTYFIDPADEKPCVFDIVSATTELIPCPFESPKIIKRPKKQRKTKTTEHA
jgi:hypothetical protein